jgi:membrane dipeptidase
MVPFVTSFVSPELHAYERQLDVANAELRARYPNDSAARRAAQKEWLSTHPRPTATLAQVADHIEHVRKVAGIDHVGIGSDFDGIEETIVGLEDVSTYPALFAELSRRGWSEADLRKLAGENVLRVLTQAAAVATRLRHERPPSTRTIQELDQKAVP